MIAPVLTDEDRDAMAHCIGHHSAKGCSTKGGRNHYVTRADDPAWCALVIRGLAVSREASIIPVGEAVVGEAVFSLTWSGRMAVEADPRSQLPRPVGRPYAIRFKGCEWSNQVYATTRGQARYRASRDLADAWNCTTHEALKMVESCRLAW